MPVARCQGLSLSAHRCWQCAATGPMWAQFEMLVSERPIGSIGSDQFRTILKSKNVAVRRQRSVVNLWRFAWRGSLKPPMSLKPSASCSSRGAFQHTYVQTTGPSSLLLLYGNGLRPSGPRQPTSNQEALGRTDIAKASTANCAMNWRDLLHIEGGQDRDRNLAAPLQHRTASLVSGISTAGA